MTRLRWWYNPETKALDLIPAYISELERARHVEECYDKLMTHLIREGGFPSAIYRQLRKTTEGVTKSHDLLSGTK